jgi:hypothetical protein
MTILDTAAGFARDAMKQLRRKRVSNRALNTKHAIEQRNDFDLFTGEGRDHKGIGPNGLPAGTAYIFSDRASPREDDNPWGD